MRRLAVLCPILIVSAVLAVAMLTTDHDWGDDFAAYILQAISILHGTEREAVTRAAFTVEHSSYYFGPVAAPWGFPTILAPAYVACGGLHIWCLKLVNVPLFLLFLVAFFLFVSRRLSRFDSVLVVSLLAFSPVLLEFHNNILSDIAFLFFSILALLLIDHVVVGPCKPEGSLRGNIGIGVVSFLAFFVRANGAVLVPTLLATQAALYVRHARNGMSGRSVLITAALPHLVFGVLVAALMALLPAGAASDLRHFRALTLQLLSDNVVGYVEIASVFFWPVPLYQFFYGALLPFLISGVVLNWTADLHVVLYAGFTLLLFVLWPAQQGVRYLFPLLPFLIYFSYRGMRGSAFALTERYRRAGDRLTRGLWLAVLASFVMASIRFAQSNLRHHATPDGGPFDAVSADMFEAIRTKTGPADVIIFYKPRLMRLMTDRNALLIDRCDQLDRGTYVVLRMAQGATDQVAPDRITTCNASLDVAPIFQNANFVVYQIVPRSHAGSSPATVRSAPRSS